MADTGPDNRRGPALPAGRASGGYFAAKRGETLAWGNLVLALVTPVGSRPMRRRWGSGLHRLVFESVRPDDPVFRLTVTDAASRCCPGVVVRGVTVSPPSTGTPARIGVTFSLADAAAAADAGG